MSWKLATFNANGIRARLGIIRDWLEAEQPDVLCVQETKVQDKDFPRAPLEELGYRASFWGQKSYNGVATLTRRPPGQVLRGFAGDGLPPEEQARLITVEVDGVWVVNTYVPQGREVADPAFQYKLDFLERLRAWLAKRFSPQKDHLVLAGDMNVAPRDLDVFDPERMQGKVTCHPKERQALARLVEWGLEDVFLRLHPEKQQFTFWDYRLPQAPKRNLGWRIDHIYASAPLARACTAARVDTAPRSLPKPSDHTFLLAEFGRAPRLACRQGRMGHTNAARMRYSNAD